MLTKQNFEKSLKISIFAVYFLIFVGGLVRSTGSGMGCPDWPKCFGQWVPPVEKSELPSNYKEIFKVQGKEIADFNVFKTWTEYVNRLIGVMIGFCVLSVFFFSFSHWSTSKEIPLLSFLTLIVLGFQGWLGAVVVSTNLAQWMITVHMIVALFIVFLLFLLLHKATGSHKLRTGGLQKLILITLALTLVQIVFGTQTREEVNLVETTLDISRSLWVDHLGIFFKIHRSFSLIILGTHIGILFLLWKKRKGIKNILLKGLLISIALEILSGIGMAYFGIPKFLQPIHLLLATIIVGILFHLYLSPHENEDFSSFR
ncbi:MAG: COX15/CtaA family protein [Bdellovibrionota bacterium]|nr:COX15/CtaA family protein [Bdellovibrionota bacterium]